MTHHLHSPLKTLFKTSCAIALLCLTLGAPAGAMMDEPESSVSTTSSSAAIPPAVQFFPYDEVILAQRELDQLPPETSVVGLWYKGLNRLPDLSRFTRLTKLTLDSNNFKNLDVRALPHLTELSLSHNPIDSFAHITGLDQLKELCTLVLVRCPLKNLDGISACQNLVSLGLTGTPLTSLRGVENLPHLKKLYVANCPLDEESQQIIDSFIIKGVYVHYKIWGGYHSHRSLSREEIILTTTTDQ